MVAVALEELVHIPAKGATLEGMLSIPEGAEGLVLFAHGSGSSRHSPRNNFVAKALNDRRIGTLLFDLLTEAEDITYQTRFDISLLTERLISSTQLLSRQPRTGILRVGYFGSSTGAAAALDAAAVLGTLIGAIVSRGGRPDLAGGVVKQVGAPTLFIVGGADEPVLTLNREVHELLRCEKKLAVIPGATHLFPEAGALEEVARLAADWFAGHLGGKAS
ncbi:MAG TPA: alpha/beta hydrolase [Nitrospiria bacterium]